MKVHGADEVGPGPNVVNEGTDVQIREYAANPVDKTTWILLYHLLLVLVAEAPLVVARPEMPNQTRVR